MPDLDSTHYFEPNRPTLCIWKLRAFPNAKQAESLVWRSGHLPSTCHQNPRIFANCCDNDYAEKLDGERGFGWKGVHGSSVTLANHNSNPVTVTDGGDPPFQGPPHPFVISAKVGSKPGTQVAVLQNTPGTYCYTTAGCPGDGKILTSPKTVIIT